MISPITLTPVEEAIAPPIGTELLELLSKAVTHRINKKLNTVFAIAFNQDRPEEYFHLRVSMIKGETGSMTLDLITNDESPAFLYNCIRTQFGGLWDGWSVDDVDDATQPDF